MTYATLQLQLDVLLLGSRSCGFFFLALGSSSGTIGRSAFLEFTCGTVHDVVPEYHFSKLCRSPQTLKSEKLLSPSLELASLAGPSLSSFVQISDRSNIIEGMEN